MIKRGSIAGASLLLLAAAGLLSAQAPPPQNQDDRARPPRERRWDGPPGNPAQRFGERRPPFGPQARPGQFPPGGPGPRSRWQGTQLPGLLFKLAEKSPEEQDRILQSNSRFNSLPSEEQRHFRSKLKRISAMTSEERQRFRERFEIFHSLPEQARDEIRNEVFPAWNALPADRRQALLEEFRYLLKMPPPERDRRFKEESFSKLYSPEEQRLLRRLAPLCPK